MQAIINLTQHNASPAQIEAGVVEPSNKELVKTLLDFPGLPSMASIIDKAQALAEIAMEEAERQNTDQVMIGGASWLMSRLESELAKRGLKGQYAFSQRVSVDKAMPDGSVEKVSVFQHMGFVPAMPACPA